MNEVPNPFLPVGRPFIDLVFKLVLILLVLWIATLLILVNTDRDKVQKEKVDINSEVCYVDTSHPKGESCG